MEEAMTRPRPVRAGRRMRSAVAAPLVLTTLLAAVPAVAAAQNNGAAARQWNVDEVIRQETFATPPPEILEAVLAPRHLNVTLGNLSPDKRWFLDEIGDGPVTMAVFSRPFHELGGVFIDFAANRARALSIRSSVGLQLIAAADGSKRAIQVPAGVRVSSASWSPDGSAVAYLGHTAEATHIYVADPRTGQSRQLTRSPLLATMVTDFEWVGDGAEIAAVLIPDGRAPMPVKPMVPAGPQVKVAEESDKNLLRTYASLMATPYDQELLRWHATGQLAYIDVANRSVRTFGQPAMIRSIDPSPDGRHVRVTRMVEPFSYVVPVGNFGSVEEIWDDTGKVLLELNERELNLGVRDDDPPAAPGVGGGQGGGDNQAGRRELAWRADGQGLSFLEQEPAPARPDTVTAADDEEQQQGGRGGQARRKDRVMQWLPPFDSSSLRVVYESETRFSGHRFSPDMQILFLTERTGQNVREYAVYLNDPATKHTLARYRTEDFYANPGSLVTLGGGGGGGRGGRGGGGGGSAPVLVSADGAHVFYQGTAYDKNPQEVAPKTFIDKVAIRGGEKQRIYESDNDGVYERVVAILDTEATQLVLSRESPTEVPQNFLRSPDGRLTQLTQNRDFTPDITSARREAFVVERPDGFKFRVNVTMPVNYRPGERPPAMFWFYPREFAGQEEYDRGARTYNKNTFPNLGLRSMDFLTRLGYAVVEPDAPIVGERGALNNNYEHDLRNNLAAVIDELDRRGLVDRQRIGIGGHSYGAFSTANAMVHTPFFKAGIAGDGAYNRTLTPLGFQSERRLFWDAPQVYLGMSPFMQANNLTGALLMYHGLHDQNVGTDPINSPRLFHALNGLGKTVSMYLYPFEDHGPATRETTLDLWARWTAWLDKYVKNANQDDAPKITTTTDASSR
jgi:dipeptidyl aminopeptidase/acylaminoacyl peptidase